MEWKPGDDDEWRLGRCPRCDHVAPVRVTGDPRFAGFSLDEEGDGFVPLEQCAVCGWGGVPRNPVKGGYFKRELLEVVDELPKMGKPCYHCGARIPRILDLETADYRRICHRARSGDEAGAIADLCAVTGCPPEWARIWVTHPLGPRRPARLWVGPPCAHCGRPLRTRLALQCFECGMDWHDPDNVRRLGTSEPP